MVCKGGRFVSSRSAIRSAKFGVVVFKASMLDWLGVGLPVELPGDQPVDLPSLV